MDDLPNETCINRVILVNYPVSHRDDFAPGDVVVPRSELAIQVGRRLTYDFDLTDDKSTQDLVIKQVLKRTRLSQFYLRYSV